MYPESLKRQDGFLIPLALFIVVVMGLLALVLARNTNVSQRGFTQELLSTQAFYAAETATQRGMQILFFPDASSRQSVDSRCAGLSTTYNFAGVDGLNLCQAQVSCTCVYQNNIPCAAGTAANYQTASANHTSIYTLTSRGSCSAGNIAAARQIQASAYLEQE